MIVVWNVFQLKFGKAREALRASARKLGDPFWLSRFCFCSAGQ
jgi:hypothetical protein